MTKKPAEPRRARALVVGTLLIAALLTACSSNSTALPSDSNSAFRPTGTPSAAFAPVADAPRDFRRLAGVGFSLDAPSAFTEQRGTSKNGQPTLTLRQPSSVAELPSAVVVIRDVKPAQDVVEQTYALEVSKRALGAKDVVRSETDWPGAQRAVLVQWTEDVAVGGDQRVPTRYTQLSVQTGPTLIFAVVGLSPVADAATSQVETVVRTFRPTATGA
jgi:hypothetical protein